MCLKGCGVSVKISDFLRFFMVAFLATGAAVADVTPDMRANSSIRTATNNLRAGSVRMQRNTNVSGAERNTKNISRTATTSRTASVNNVARSATNTQKINAGRSAVTTKTSSSLGRSAATPVNIGRATAVFSDVSKIGSGYAECRDAYATCMDQFCAVMNDKYRRCYCSEKLSEFQNTEDALDQAVSLLAKFEDNNLNAVDKTAAEVNAMYSATAGEAAIKNDTSGAAQMLNEIGDLLAGRKSKNATNTYTSLNGTSIDFSVEIDDVWSDTSASNIFATSGAKDLSTLSGIELYNNALSQCLEMISGSCQNDAVMNMAKSSYSIMITQDCNAYSKNIDSKREQVKQTVRTAEKYLREARLDEYRSHNSADMNACITKVKTAIQQDLACGENYNRCLDNTGAYINSTTGEPIYSPRLFQLTDIITLGGIDNNNDVLSQNPNFDKFLDSKRKFAETALSTCRDIADDVWTEFKRTALIEIAQAQDEKIESVKMSCVQTMTECYDTQSGALKDFDTSTSKAASALGVVTTREICADKVVACAALYNSNGDSKACNFDKDGKLQNGERCGLTSLLNFVDTVDTARVSEACDTIVENYLTNLCTPTTGEYGYPYNCRTLSINALTERVQKYADQNCTRVSGTEEAWKQEVNAKVDNAMTNVAYEMADMFKNICATQGGIFVDPGSDQKGAPRLGQFYQTLYGNKNDANTDHDSWGICMQNTVKMQCEVLNSSNKVYATYNETTGNCEFNIDYYKYKCDVLRGIWDESVTGCYIEN